MIIPMIFLLPVENIMSNDKTQYSQNLYFREKMTFITFLVCMAILKVKVFTSILWTFYLKTF